MRLRHVRKWVDNASSGLSLVSSQIFNFGDESSELVINNVEKLEPGLRSSFLDLQIISYRIRSSTSKESFIIAFSVGEVLFFPSMA